MRAKSPNRSRQKAAPAVADHPSEVMAVRPTEAMRQLGIGASTFWKLVKRGDIRVSRVGCNITLVPMAEMRRFLEAHSVEPPPDTLAAE